MLATVRVRALLCVGEVVRGNQRKRSGHYNDGNGEQGVMMVDEVGQLIGHVKLC